MCLDEMLVVQCPACGSEQFSEAALLGQLGQMVHYRCRYCGMGFSQLSAPETLSDESLGDAGC